jgi:protocatechuate 3,4-dioxygenase beta subunit
MYYRNANTLATARHIAVIAPAINGSVDAALRQGSLIDGTVTDAATGQPVSYAQIEVYDDSGNRVSRATSNILGHYRIEGALPSGAYRVEFSRDGYATVFYGGAGTLDTATAITITAPTNRSNIDAALTRGATLSGRITAADTHQPLAGALVSLYTSDGHVVDTVQTGAAGSYSFDNLLSGTYRLGVAAAQASDGTPAFKGYLAVFYGGALSLAGARAFNLSAAQRATLDVAMPRGVFIPVVRR